MEDEKQKGFGIIETLAAIFFISVGLLAILGMANRCLQGANYLKMKLIASFLAQEGIETVRFVRELSPDWADWYALISPSPTNYLVEYDDDTWQEIVSQPFSERPLKISNGAYQYSVGTNSPFYRKVTLSKPNDSDEVKIEVEIKWLDRVGWRYIRAEDRLWNWR
ncbi:hypothetical protein HY798_00870 [Candidatus Falkowbacteria bacterium]|nr:hypothetical protein [Candidatus Falkowbacteria bacterium]